MISFVDNFFQWIQSKYIRPWKFNAASGNPGLCVFRFFDILSLLSAMWFTDLFSTLICFGKRKQNEFDFMYSVYI